MLVQKLRLQRGWSQQQLAELSGLSVRTIQRVENGQPASTETLKSLASVFETDFSALSSEPQMNSTSTTTEEQLAFAHVRRIKRFYVHLAIYVIVITTLFAINLSSPSGRVWAVWPALGWGLALLVRASSVFELFPFMGADWERRQVEKRLGRTL